MALGISAASSPGPFQAFLINQTLILGFRRSAGIAFAPLIADIPIVLTILLLLERLPEGWLRWINLAGGLWLLYLTWKLWSVWRVRRALEEAPDANPGEGVSSTPRPRWASGLAHGILMNALSPGPYTFWTLVNGPILISALRQGWGLGVTFLLGFYGALTLGFLSIAALFHQARRLGPDVVRRLTFLSILILALFAGYLLKNALWG